MARQTIRARRASPYLIYLLIAFVVLTVTFAVLFAWSYSTHGKVMQTVFGEQRLKRASTNDVDPVEEYIFGKGFETPLLDAVEQAREDVRVAESELRQVLFEITGDRYEELSGKQLHDMAQTVAGQYAANKLSNAGQTLGTKAAVPAGVDEAEMPDFQTVTPENLFAAIDNLVTRIDNLRELVAIQERKYKGVQTENTQLTTQIQELKTAHQQQIDEIKATHAATVSRLEQARGSSQDLAAQLRQRVNELSNQINAERQEWQRRKKKFEQTIAVKDQRIQEISEKLAETKEPLQPIDVDGHIVRVARSGNVVYSDLGEKDGIPLGLTFAIISPTDVGAEDAQPKATARVVRVLDNTSELRLTKVRKPVAEGDALVNPIYDRQRRLSFRLVGKMDMDDDGIDDSERVKGIIQKFGGRVVEEIGIHTDYLVIGEEPDVPRAPGPDATPLEVELYQEARQAFIEYNNTVATAKNFSIPILGLKRFLDVVGIQAGR